MNGLGWLSVLLAGAFLGGLTIRAMLSQVRPRRRRHLGLVSEDWRGFERQEEERHLEELRHRP